MKGFLNKLFNFQYIYGGMKYKVTIFGIKLTFPTLYSLIAKKTSVYYKYKKNNLNITTLPPATGQMRDVQLANLTILKEFDKFCRENNLTYWLEYGTMLGAIRHKGYIPWDDDIDVGMPRNDYERLRDIFEEKSPNSNLHFVHIKNINGMYLLKLAHKECDLLFIDIFPHDYCKKHSTREEKDATIEKVKAIRNDFIDRTNIEDLTDSEFYAKYAELRKSVGIFEEKDDTKQQDLIFGIEFGHFTNNFVEEYNDIFPLKEYEFEGYQFFGVNNYDQKLKELYTENYMGYPPDICWGHSGYIKLSKNYKRIVEIMKQKSGRI